MFSCELILSILVYFGVYGRGGVHLLPKWLMIILLGGHDELLNDSRVGFATMSVLLFWQSTATCPSEAMLLISLNSFPSYHYHPVCPIRANRYKGGVVTGS